MDLDKTCEDKIPFQPHAIPRGLLKLVILTLLEENELTGIEIIRLLEMRSGGVWRPSPGSIYPILSHLESHEFIEATTVSGRSKAYKLSEKGRQMLTKIREKKQHFDKKARIGPLFWFELLNPADHAFALVTMLKTFAKRLLDLTSQLKKSQRKRIIRELRVVNELIESISDENGGE